MWINNKGLHLFGGKLKDTYTYTPPTIETEYFQGRKRSNFVLLDSSYGMGKLTLPIVFEGENRKDVALKKSNFEKEFFGRSEIGLPGEFSYFAFLESIGTPSFPSECMIETTYSLNCIRHGWKQTVESNTVYCESTLPNTDCIIKVTALKDAEEYPVGTVTFLNVKAGELLVVDGMDKRILVNGAPAANRAEWIRFPSLVPGENHIECPDEVTVEFYPVYF